MSFMLSRNEDKKKKQELEADEKKRLEITEMKN